MDAPTPLDGARETTPRASEREASSTTTRETREDGDDGDDARARERMMTNECRMRHDSTEMTPTTTSRDRERASPASSPTTPSTMDARATRVDEDGSSRRVAETIELFESKSKSKSATPRTPRTRTGEDASEETVSPMRAADLERALVGAFERFGSFGRRRSGARASPKMDGTRFAKLAKEVVFAGEDEEKLRMAEIAFAKRARLARHVDYETFRQLILEDCVDIAGDGATEISTASKLVGAAPSVGDALSPGKCRFHDDVRAYTGVAAEKHGLDRTTGRRNAGAQASASSVDDDGGGGAGDAAALPKITGLFSAFERFLQFSPSQATLSLPRWLKVCEDASLYDDAFDATNAGIVFKAVSRANRPLDFNDFKRALLAASRRADVSYVTLASRVAAAEPVLRGAAAAVVSPHRFHDDDSTYTATHRAKHGDKILTPRARSIRDRAAESSRASAA